MKARTSEKRSRKQNGNTETNQCFLIRSLLTTASAAIEVLKRGSTTAYRSSRSKAKRKNERTRVANAAFSEMSAKRRWRTRTDRPSSARGCVRQLASLDVERYYLVDPASSYMLVSKTKPCKCKYGPVTINGWHCERLITSVAFEAVLRPEVGKWITVEMLELIHAKSADWPFRRSEGAHLSVYCVGRAKACQRVLTLDNCERSPPSMRRRRIAQTSVLSTFVGTVPAYRGAHGWRGIRVRFRRGSPRNGCHFQGRQQARKLPTSQKSASER